MSILVLPASGPYDFGDATLGAMDLRLFGRARERDKFASAVRHTAERGDGKPNTFDAVQQRHGTVCAGFARSVTGPNIDQGTMQIRPSGVSCADARRFPARI